MRRETLFLLATAGVIAALWIAQVASQGRVERNIAGQTASTDAIDWETSSPPLDPAVAAAEISDIRARFGTVLAGSTLAATEHPEEFTAAIAQETGVTVESSALGEDDKHTMQSSLKELERCAERYESLKQYATADELRKIASDLRQLIRKLDEAQAIPLAADQGQSAPSTDAP